LPGEEIISAVYITNGFVAAVYILNLKEHGVSIPDDIAIVGFNKPN
jgi:DNA-binding LacI/PurR family transcriptional regulator